MNIFMSKFKLEELTGFSEKEINLFKWLKNRGYNFITRYAMDGDIYASTKEPYTNQGADCYCKNETFIKIENMIDESDLQFINSDDIWIIPDYNEELYVKMRMNESDRMAMIKLERESREKEVEILKESNCVEVQTDSHVLKTDKTEKNIKQNNLSITSQNLNGIVVYAKETNREVKPSLYEKLSKLEFYYDLCCFYNKNKDDIKNEELHNYFETQFQLIQSKIFGSFENAFVCKKENIEYYAVFKEKQKETTYLNNDIKIVYVERYYIDESHFNIYVDGVCIANIFKNQEKIHVESMWIGLIERFLNNIDEEMTMEFETLYFDIRAKERNIITEANRKYREEILIKSTKVIKETESKISKYFNDSELLVSDFVDNKSDNGVIRSKIEKLKEVMVINGASQQEEQTAKEIILILQNK